MPSTQIQALKNAAASSAMEGMPLTEQNITTIKQILDGKLTLNDYLKSIQLKYENHQQ